MEVIEDEDLRLGLKPLKNNLKLSGESYITKQMRIKTVNNKIYKERLSL